MAAEISSSVSEQGATPKIMQKELNNMARTVAWGMGYLWHQTMRPDHFTRDGARKYEFQDRQGEGSRANETKNYWTSYSGRKRRKMKHSDPLKYTGESEAATQTANIVSTATRLRSVASVKMRAPRLNYKRTSRSGVTIDKVAELLKVTPEESEQITRFSQREIQERIAQLRSRKQTAKLA